MTYASRISNESGINHHQVAAAIELFEQGNTVPFIARYRKEATGSLDEEQLRLIQSQLEKLGALDDRRQTVLKSIEEQGALNDELRQKIEAVATLTALEDLYAPYKPKRRTRASIAREHGLQPLAELILQQAHPHEPLEVLLRRFLNAEVRTIEDAMAGAVDIAAEWISDHAEIRRQTREKALQWGTMRCERSERGVDEKRVYEHYYEFEFRIDRLRPHQVLAINRGEAEGVLREKVTVPERDWRGAVGTVLQPDPRSPFANQLNLAIEDSAQRLLLPAIERDIRRMLTEQAEGHAISVFAENLRALLSQPPLVGHNVLGLDPGFRTGCKVAVVDATGRLLATGTIYPHEPQKARQKSIDQLNELVERYSVSLIAIGNGTASRETEQLVAELIQGKPDLHYLIVSEAGASIYSASPLARQELPELDVSLRGAVSIARRAQDPLAELVKIDPKSIGVGMYQHDVDQKRLGQVLREVVESVVNSVGVDLNTASPALLSHVAGIGPRLAEKIVLHRNQNGLFGSRSDLHKVSGMGPKAFEQSAGFLRIRSGGNPLDASAIHPESYLVAEAIMWKAGIVPDSGAAARKDALEALFRQQTPEALAAELGVGTPTLLDILEQLVRPGRDPRQDLPAPNLRSDVLSMEDLATGMRLKGTVRNVVDFGVFVDIGVKQDGLLHRSQLPRGESLHVGDVIDVTILKIEIERGRIGLGWPD